MTKPHYYLVAAFIAVNAACGGCAAERPSVTLGTALGPSCNELDDIATDHKSTVDAAASASFQEVAAGKAGVTHASSASVHIKYVAQPKTACASIQRTAQCFGGLAADSAERDKVQAIWAPIIAAICQPPAGVASPDVPLPPSAASLVLPQSHSAP